MSNIFIIFEILLILIIKSNLYEIGSIKQLYNGQIIQDIWIINKSYIYYINITKYTLETESVFQALGETQKVLKNISVSLIDESILNDNKSEIIKIITYPTKFHVKYRTKPRRYYYELLIKKIKKEQKYFVILIEPDLEQNSTEVDICASTKIQENHIYENDLSNGQIINKKFFMYTKLERFIKFNFHNISLENHNIIFLIEDRGVSIFYMKDISSKEFRTKLLILPKNSTQEKDHIVYLSLIGPANKTKIQIMLDDHDIKFIYSAERLTTSFYIQRLNCTNDLYIFESYFNVDEKKTFASTNYLDFNSLYGDYDLYLYDDIEYNISKIFKSDEDDIEKLNENAIKQFNGEFNVLKLRCKTPTFLRIKYISDNESLNIDEGVEKIVKLNQCPNDEDIYKGNKVNMNQANKEYKFYFGYYKYDNIQKTFITTSMGYSNIELNSEKTSISLKVYYYENKNKNLYHVDVKDKYSFYKLYLTSNQYFKNVIEGITKINKEDSSIAFKVKKDIIFDYFIFKAYSLNFNISIDYEFKIVEKENIDNDKVMVGMRKVSNYQERLIYLKLSNPYDKFNSKIKEDDYVYLLVKFIVRNEAFPIYVDIRYYYNNSIITLEPSNSNILLNNKEYKIFGDRNYEKVESILLNINKCNPSKNYSLKTFYENNDNLILEENVIDKRTFLFHDNLFNNTKFILQYNGRENNNSMDNGEKQFHLASYYETGDLYMNYFPIKEEFYNILQTTKDFSISFEDSMNETTFSWNDYLLDMKDKKDFPINYSIYILPQDSPINSICQMSLIPPNISLIDKNNYKIYLEKGKYKISILASIINNNFPLTTYYDFLNFEIPKKLNIKLILIFSFLGLALIILTIIIIIYCKKKKKAKNIDPDDYSRKSRLLSALGIDIGREGIIFDNEDEEEEEEKKEDYFDNDNRIPDNDEKLNENDEEVLFSMPS